MTAFLVDFCNFRHITYTFLFCFICQFIFVGGKMPLSQQLHYVYCRSRTSRRIPYAKGQHSKICCLPACLPSCLSVFCISVCRYCFGCVTVSLSLCLLCYVACLDSCCIYACLCGYSVFVGAFNCWSLIYFKALLCRHKRWFFCFVLFVCFPYPWSILC